MTKNKFAQLQRIKKIIAIGKKKYVRKLDENGDIIPTKEDLNTVDALNPMPWIEKYRPHVLDKIIGQTVPIKIFKKSIEKGNLPHVLLYGPPGTGKTSTALALVRELFGPKIAHERVKEMNASDDRGINTVRKNIKDFAKQTVGKVDPNYPCPPYKVIILDEADAMTSDAQNALRVIMERYSKYTRFIIVCNYITLINDPIISRCAKFYFAPLPTSQSLERIKFIADKEKVGIDETICKKILDITEGDLRSAIMMLQNIKYYKQVNKTFNIDDLDVLRGAMPYKKIVKKVKKIKNLKRALKFAKNIIDNSYSINSTIESISKCILEDEKIPDQKKSAILFVIADIEKRLLDGADEYIQLLVILITIFKNK